MQSTSINPGRTAPSKPVLETYSFSLPAAGYVRLPVVAGVSGLAKSTVWSWTAQGKFPKPVKLGPRTTAWPVAAVREWLADPPGWQAKHKAVA